jgi:uncharacterized membrane protein
MKVKILVIALIVLVIVNIAALGTFWYMHHRGPSFVSGDMPRREWRMQRWGGHHLDREERRNVFRAMRSLHQEVRPVIEQTGQLEDQLIAALKEDPVPRARIDSLLRRISDNRLEIARRTTDRMIAMGDSLSAEEREAMIDAIARFRRGGGPGPMNGGPPRRWRRN